MKITDLRNPRKSFRHPIAELGTSCFHLSFVLCECDEVQAAQVNKHNAALSTSLPCNSLYAAALYSQSVSSSTQMAWNHEMLSSTGWAKKVSRKPLSISSPNINLFSNFFHQHICGKFVVKMLLNMPPHFNCVATLPCEIQNFWKPL